MKLKKSDLFTYAGNIVIALAVGGLSTWLNAGKMNISEIYIQPTLSPPAWLFPIVWTVLFTLMGISAAKVCISGCEGSSDALFIYAIQLVVNFLWTVFFFSFQALFLSLLWLVFLILLVILMIVRFMRCVPSAGYLQIPCLVWLFFAAYLNLGLWLMNR